VLDRTAPAAELPGIEDLLREYLSDRGTTGPALDHVMATLSELQAEPEPADPAPCCEETLLTAAIAGESFDGVDRAGLLIRAEVPGAEELRRGPWNCPSPAFAATRARSRSTSPAQA
jgi:exonuclease SbcD